MCVNDLFHMLHRYSIIITIYLIAIYNLMCLRWLWYRGYLVLFEYFVELKKHFSFVLRISELVLILITFPQGVLQYLSLDIFILILKWINPNKWSSLLHTIAQAHTFIYTHAMQNTGTLLGRFARETKSRCHC